MSEYPTYLIHYGIQGQKWGVRRFQNEDGTYTDDGLLRRKEQKHFVKEQTKTNRKFDKLTDKIQARQAAGKKVSDKKIKKAIELGTKHRALDYISQNPRPYLTSRGLNKASKARNAVAVSSLAALGVANASVGSIFGATSSVSAIVESIAQRKLEKMFLNQWQERQYGKAFEKCKNMTIKDLEEHGINISSKIKSQYGAKESTKIEKDVNEVKSGVAKTAKGVGNITKAAWRTTRMAGSSAGSLIKGTVKGVGAGVRTVAKGGDIQDGAKNFTNEAKIGAKNAQNKITERSKNDIAPVLNTGIRQVGVGVRDTAVGVGHTSRDAVNEVKKKKRRA